MRELQPGEPIGVEDHHSVEVWTGRVERAGKAVIVLVNRDKPPPVELRPSAPVRIGFGDGRWYVKIRAKVLEREEHTLKIGLVGTEQRIQRRAHLRVAMNQTTTVHCTRKGEAARSFEAEVLDISEGGCRLRCDEPLNAGDWLKFHVNLDGPVVEVSGAVVRTWPEGEHTGVGVRSLDASSAARYAIARYVIERNMASGAGQLRRYDDSESTQIAAP